MVIQRRKINERRHDFALYLYVRLFFLGDQFKCIPKPLLQCWHAIMSADRLWPWTVVNTIRLSRTCPLKFIPSILLKSLTKDTSSLCTLVRLIRLNGSSLSLSTMWGRLSDRSHSQLTVEPDFLFYNILAFICTCGTHQVVNLLRMYVCSRQWERLDWKWQGHCAVECERQFHIFETIRL